MASEETFASGRYSKRKRTKITYDDPQSDLSDADTENEDTLPKKRVRSQQQVLDRSSGTNSGSGVDRTVDQPEPSGMKHDRHEAGGDLDKLDPDSDYDMTHSKARKPFNRSKAKGNKAAKPKKSAKSKVFPFLQLPAELRIQIYEHALMDVFGVHFKAEDIKGERRLMIDRRRSPAWLRQRLSPALLVVNKQIHREAGEFLYKNEFVFSDTFAFNCFAEKIGIQNIQQLRTVRILYLSSYSKRDRNTAMACFMALKLATGLVAFHMHHGNANPQHYLAFSRVTEADRFFNVASSWLFAVGAAQGNLEAGIDLLQFGYTTHQDFLDKKFFRPEAEELAQSGYRKFKDRLRVLLMAERKRLQAKQYPPNKIKKTKNKRRGG